MAELASEHDVPAKEKAATRSLRPRVPTSVAVTLLGAALTVWLAPAFTRQWEDRQQARDLQAGFAEQIVVSAFRTIRDGARLAHGEGQYDVILAQWKEAGLTTEVKAKAYFAPPIVSQWTDVVQNLEYFLIVCQDIRRRPQGIGLRSPRGRHSLRLQARANQECIGTLGTHPGAG